MQAKRYTGENMRLALKKVREDLGSEAIILSSKRVADGIEVLAALEQQPAPATAAEQAGQIIDQNPFKQAVEESMQQAQQAVRAQTSSRLERELEQMQRESRERALAIKTQQLASPQPVKAHADTVPAQNAADNVSFLKARQEDANQQTIDKLVATSSVTLPSNEIAQLRQELQSIRSLVSNQWSAAAAQNPQAIAAEQIPALQQDIVDEGGVFALVGPNGSGKTTTIGKLATRYVLKHGAEDIALITTDTQRIGAQEQLRTIGRILKVPVYCIDRNNQLDDTLSRLSDKKLVLIDTAGMNRNDSQLPPLCKHLNRLEGAVKTLLVLPASSQLGVLQNSLEAFDVSIPVACVITKLDESASVSEVLSLVIARQLAIAYSCSGPAIPEHIQLPEVSELAGLAQRSVGVTATAMSANPLPFAAGE